MCPNYRLVVGERDTWSIPFVVSHHTPLENDKFVFTIRRVVEQHKLGRPSVKGTVVFQQEIEYASLIPVVDDEGDTVGCKFVVHANKAQTALIPKGVNSYDLAIVNDSLGSEIELVPPSDFIVGEVLR